jgi:hypothetical protein
MPENFRKIQKKKTEIRGKKSHDFLFSRPKTSDFQLPVVSYVAFTPRLNFFLKFVVNLHVTSIELWRGTFGILI